MQILMCISYVQSVKEVIFRLLVLQEQLQVFKYLKRNQQRFNLFSVKSLTFNSSE